MIMNESWIEKFRPNNLDEIESQEEIIFSLKNCIKKKNITHLLNAEKFETFNRLNKIKKRSLIENLEIESNLFK